MDIYGLIYEILAGFVLSVTGFHSMECLKNRVIATKKYGSVYSIPSICDEIFTN